MLLCCCCLELERIELSLVVKKKEKRGSNIVMAESVMVGTVQCPRTIVWSIFPLVPRFVSCVGDLAISALKTSTK